MNACSPVEPLPPVVADYFANTGDTFNKYQAGYCGPLTHAVSMWLKQRGVSHKRIMITRSRAEGSYLQPAVKSQPSDVWYHAIIVVDGLVHCPWLNRRVAVDEYCTMMFPNQGLTIGENYKHCTDVNN